jgi:hypothetical protein
VSRGVVARSVAALSKTRNRLLGYVENMSGYYCRDCRAIKPLFEHSASAEASARLTSRSSILDIPCLGTVPFDPELARHCDQGIPFPALKQTPVGASLDQIAQRVLRSLKPAAAAPAHSSSGPGADKERLR